MAPLAEINDLKSVILRKWKRPLRSGFNHGELAAIGRDGMHRKISLRHTREDSARPDLEPRIGYVVRTVGKKGGKHRATLGQLQPRPR